MDTIKNKIKAVIFDMDGTIIKTEHAWDQATKSVLLQKGFATFTDHQQEVLDSFSGIGLFVSAKILKKEFRLEDSIEQIVHQTKHAAHKIFESGLDFIDGFELFHKRLQELSIPTSVATNADQASLTMLSSKLRLARFFGSNLYSIETVGNKAKPNPDIFLHAAKQLNVAPQECVVFEDSIFGFQAAKAAGMKCIAIKSNGNQGNLALANHAISSYHEAEKALITIF